MAINPHRRSSFLLLLADVVTVVLVFNCVTFLRGITVQPLGWPFLVPVLVQVIAMYLIDGYGSRADMLSLDYASLHLIASFFAVLATLLLTYAVGTVGFELRSSRAVIVLSFGLIGPITLALRRILYERTAVAREGRSIVFVGERGDFEVFSAECERLGTQRPLRFVGTGEAFQEFEAVLDSTARSELAVEAIVVKESGKGLPSDVPLKLVQLYFKGIPTYTLEIFHQVYWRKIPIYRINPVWLLQEGFQIAREPVFERIKRCADIGLSLFGLLVTSPLVAAAALAIKLEDGGPVFYAQTRVGRHKVSFTLAKLRTMRVSTAEGDLYTRPGDARITRVGRWLRSARLDELPQLWNVLRGDMSLIGPRAEWDRLVGEYERDIPCYHFRHLVKPGITGWAQVNYRYGSGVEDTLRKLEYDLYYIRNFSFMLDASIVLKTLHVMLHRKGH
ncbi:MAG TPA: exopolysaccharide biosynthesis polyprenyl glycosylphosphotransferase [Opitutaceae bacterium]